jgi:hypothetical protein
MKVETYLFKGVMLKPSICRTRSGNEEKGNIKLHHRHLHKNLHYFG